MYKNVGIVFLNVLEVNHVNNLSNRQAWIMRQSLS